MPAILTSVVLDAISDLKFAQARLRLAQETMAEAPHDEDIDMDAVETCVQTADRYVQYAMQKLDYLLKGDSHEQQQDL